MSQISRAASAGSEIPVLDYNIEEQLLLSHYNDVRVENEVRNKLADNSVDSIEDQSERQPRITRARILTEKGQPIKSSVKEIEIEKKMISSRSLTKFMKYEKNAQQKSNRT